MQASVSGGLRDSMRGLTAIALLEFAATDSHDSPGRPVSSLREQSRVVARGSGLGANTPECLPFGSTEANFFGA